MKTLARATKGGVTFAADAVEPWHDLSSSVASIFEVAGGDTTLVVVDMQQRFLNGWDGPSQPPVAAVVRQVQQAMKMGWSIVLIEFEPDRLGTTISPIAQVLEGYDRVERCSKRTPSGAKELVNVCYARGFGMGLFRFTGVYLDACVLETVLGVLDLEPASLVRFMQEGCATDIDLPGAWSWVQERFESQSRVAISSERIDENT